MILETARLYLRELCLSDFPALCKILQDEDVMYAYEHAFSDAEVTAWLQNQLRRYREYGFGLWAVILKDTDEVIGQCGLTLQPTPQGEVLEMAICFKRLIGTGGMPRKRHRPAKHMHLTPCAPKRFIPLSVTIITRHSV